MSPRLPVAPTPSQGRVASPPQVELTGTAGALRWAMSGTWVAAELARPETWARLMSQLPAPGSAPAPGSWDLRAIDRLDHVGAQLLWNLWGRQWPAHLQAEPAQRAVLEHVAQNTAPPEQVPSTAWTQPIANFGDRVLSLGDHASDMLRLVGQLVLDAGHLLRRPQDMPWRDVSGHLYRIGATALPITALVGFLIGVTLAYLTAQQLQQFGADAFIVNILGLALVRELGPVLAAILIAGRSGSAITAQIGVMRVTEELDAMRVMGIPHGLRLVLPRALALAVVMPLVSVWTTCFALAGGVLASQAVLGITPTYFLNSLPEAVALSNLVLATAKSVVFGVLIALVGCHFGLRVQPNTESLGQGTTASVVASITIVLLVDALFAVAFEDVGL